MNNLDRKKPLRLGKTIKIPVGGAARDISKPKKQVYIVKSGDTLSEIAEQYRTSVKKIKRWNNLQSNIIRVGQKIIIKK